MKVYAVNLKDRPERKKFILKQFKNKSEFKIKIISTEKNPNARLDLWNNLIEIIKIGMKEDSEFIIFCEDDHEFTHSYSRENLQQTITDTFKLKPDILLGGISWFKNAVKLNKNIYWVDQFTGAQFTIIFKRMYKKILEVKDFNDHDALDLKISKLTTKKYLIFPFISVQKEFGYSDCTPRNATVGRVSWLFEQTVAKLEMLGKISEFYKAFGKIKKPIKELLASITLPVHAIMSVDNFSQKNINDCNFEFYFYSNLNDFIRNMDNIFLDNDFIILTFDEVNFRNEISSIELSKTIRLAHFLRSDLLFGGVHGNENAVPILKNLYWFDTMKDFSSVIIYKAYYQRNRESLLQSTSKNHLLEALNKASCKVITYPFFTEITWDASTSKLDLNKIRTVQNFNKSETNFSKYKDLPNVDSKNS